MENIQLPRSDNENVSLVLVMGITGSGKSYFINKAAQRSLVKVGHSLESCTDKAVPIPATIGREKVIFIDTPGFDDTYRSDAEILTEISELLSFQYECGLKLKGVLFLHRITDTRMQGMSLKTLNICHKICGNDALKNVILVTTRWNEVDSKLGAQRETELREKFWKFMLGYGSTMMRYHGDEDSAVAITSQLIGKSAIVLDIQRELVDQGKKLNETKAGAFVNKDLEDLKTEYERQFKELEQLRRDLVAGDQKMRADFQKSMDEEKRKLERAKYDQEQLQRPVGVEVREDIQRTTKKRRGLGKLLPFLPTVISLLGHFIGIPPGTFDIFTSWLDGTDFGDFFTDFTGSF